jgi:hypothetical protein
MQIKTVTTATMRRDGYAYKRGSKGRAADTILHAVGNQQHM